MAIEQFYMPELSGQLAADTLVQDLRRINGVRAIQISLATHTLRVEHDGQVEVSTLIKAINRAGYVDVSVLA